MLRIEESSGTLTVHDAPVSVVVTAVNASRVRCNRMRDLESSLSRGGFKYASSSNAGVAD